MTADYITISKNLLLNNMGAKENETILILCDESKVELAEFMHKAAREISDHVFLLCFPTAEKSGTEPPELAAIAMTLADVVVVLTEHSITHTKAKKNACAKGVRVATMPGITKDMFSFGAITADYKKVVELTETLVNKLTAGKYVTISKSDRELSFSIEKRLGISSTGIYKNKGESGNLPSGEAYIAPVEGSAEGTMLVDGSFVGAGKLSEPMLLTIRRGRLVDASGKEGSEILALLGSGEGRTLAEFGIGTNEKARLTGNVLEDEKIYGTVHLAFGSNATFGGKTNAGVHLDGVIMAPTFSIDDQLIMKAGKLLDSAKY